MKKNFKYLFMFLVIIAGTLVMSSCSKDDDDDKNDNKPSTEESVTSSIVGTWICIESEDDYYFESTVTFYSNGKFSSNSSESYPGGHYSSEDSGTYLYSEKTNKLTLNFTYSSSGVLGRETGTVLWEGTSTFYITDVDGDITGPFKKVK